MWPRGPALYPGSARVWARAERPARPGAAWRLAPTPANRATWAAGMHRDAWFACCEACTGSAGRVWACMCSAHSIGLRLLNTAPEPAGDASTAAVARQRCEGARAQLRHAPSFNCACQAPHHCEPRPPRGLARRSSRACAVRLLTLPAATPSRQPRIMRHEADNVLRAVAHRFSHQATDTTIGIDGTPGTAV